MGGSLAAARSRARTTGASTPGATRWTCSPQDSKYNDEIARAAVTQATKRTFANRGRKLDLSNVIDHLNGRIWTPGTGWHEYNGTVGPHVHVQAAPIKTGTPACA